MGGLPDSSSPFPVQTPWTGLRDRAGQYALGTLDCQRLTARSPPSDYKAYEDAAEEFHPYIPFFATFDSKVLFLAHGWNGFPSPPELPLLALSLSLSPRPHGIWSLLQADSPCVPQLLLGH